MENSLTLIEIFTILFIHWIADFWCQTDWMAKNKSISNKALTYHVLAYSTIWLLVCNCYSIITNNYLILALFPAITFISHWMTDYFTSRLNSKLWKEGKVHYFFVSIGGDQILHYVQLFLTFYLLKNF